MRILKKVEEKLWKFKMKCLDVSELRDHRIGFAVYLNFNLNFENLSSLIKQKFDYVLAFR